MIPDPLHPAIVHFPIVLAVFAPIVAAALVWAIQSRRLPARVWIAMFALQAVLVGSGWLALETGEHEEERVEHVVSEESIEDHEEGAERFFVLAALTLPVAAAGLLGSPIGVAARAITVVASFAVAAAVVSVGHSGGNLVYGQGAATAYVDARSPGLEPDHGYREDAEHEEHEEYEDD